MNIRTILCLTAIVVVFVPDAMGCKYTVRDVGFVDLGSKPYRLFLSLPEDVDEATEDVTTKLQASLLDTNIDGSLLSAGDSESSDESAGAAPDEAATVAAARQFLDRQGISDRPIGVLVSPDDRMRLIDPLGKDDAAESESVAATVRSIARAAAYSPLRQQVVADLLSSHSVVLLVEGTDPDQNSAARDLANESIRRIADNLKSLPKLIENPPKLVVVTQDQAADEMVFLWSLGIPTDRSDSAHLVALFGRLRSMGDVLTVPGATARDLSGFLYFVGQDCECELDRSVMQGTMAPHIWDGPLQADAAKALGFDPGHAVVRVEMSRILARGFTSGRRNLGIGIGDSPFDRAGALGYEEIEIEVLEDEDEEGGQETGESGRGKGESGTESPSQQLVVGNNGQTTTSERLAGRDTVASETRETSKLVTEGQPTAEETAPSFATSLGVTIAAVAAIALVLCVVVLLRARGGP